MNWFEEQIKQRIKTDNEMLTDAVAKMVKDELAELNA